MKKIFIIICVCFCFFYFCGCKQYEEPEQNTKYHINIHYSLNEKEDEVIDFTSSNINDIKLNELRVDGYTFLGYFENNKKVESIELRDYNLITKYEEKEYHINISYNGVVKDNDVINFTISSLSNINLEKKEDSNKVFAGYFENGERIKEITDLKDYNLEARFIDYDIYLLDLDWTNYDGMLFSELEEKYPEYVLDPTRMYANLLTIDVLDDNLKSEYFYWPERSLKPIREAIDNDIIELDSFLFYWEVIPVLNDIINNNVVFGTCSLNDEAHLRIYSKRGEEVLFDNTYSVNANDYIVYSTDDVRDYSGNNAKYIYNKINDERVEELTYPVSLFFTLPDETKAKVEEFVKTKKIDDSQTIKDYLSNLHTSYYYQITYDITATVVVNGKEIKKTFHMIEEKLD